MGRVPMGTLTEAALDVAAGDDVTGAAGRAAAVLGILGDGEDHLAVLVFGADVVIAADAEGMIQQAGGHADLPVRSHLTQLQVESACPRFSSPAPLLPDEPYFALNDAWFVGTRQAQKIVKRVANRAKLAREVTPHVLRHTWATLALQKGISLAAVQKILGHDRLTTTAIYLNLTDGHVLEEFEAKW